MSMKTRSNLVSSMSRLTVNLLSLLVILIAIVVFTPQKWQDKVITYVADTLGLTPVEVETTVTSVGEFEEAPRLIIGHQQITDSITRTQRLFMCDEAKRVLVVQMKAEYVYDIKDGGTEITMRVDSIYDINIPATSAKWQRCNYSVSPFDAVIARVKQDSILNAIKLTPGLNDQEVRERAKGIIQKEYLKWKITNGV